MGVGGAIAATGIWLHTLRGDESTPPPFAKPVIGLGALVLVVSICYFAIIDETKPVLTTSDGMPLPAPALPVPAARCVPVAPDSPQWTCGEGYRCTEDFAGCEPAEGTPLRQR